MDNFEQQKKGLFDLINSWNEKNIKIANLIWKNNPALEQAVWEEYKALLMAKDYHRLSGLKLLTHINTVKCDNLDDRVKYISKIYWLSINDTALNQFPLAYLQELQQLKIYNTSIAQLPKSISNLCSLEVLDLEGCSNLDVLPPSLALLPQLHTIKFRGTKVSEQYQIYDLTDSESIQEFFNVTAYQV